jgi:hypothetical protein
MQTKRSSRDGRAWQLGFAMGGVKKMRPSPRRSHGDTGEMNVDMRGTIAADTTASVRFSVRERPSTHATGSTSASLPMVPFDLEPRHAACRQADVAPG